MTVRNLNDISTWKQSYGFLPIHLFPTHMDENSFIMLNGGYGDFCIKTERDERSPEEFYSLAWSSNTKIFVILNESNINIYNWKKGGPETIKRKQVEDNFDKFYEYLVRSSHKSDDDIVPFVIEIFKQFRNLTLERKDAVEALDLLFVLLAGLEDDLNSMDFNKWGLTSITIPSDFNHYTDKLKKGFLNIKPKLELIIRHSAGILFQEAQKEVLFFDRQTDLWGRVSSNIYFQKNLYSSIHYTPPYLARSIVETAIREIDIKKQLIKIFDPSCGSAEFLIEALKQLNEKRYAGTVQIIGWDSSPTAINTSSFLLQYEKRTIWQDRLNFQIKLVNDSLQEQWDNNYDLILMNPPFVSWEQMNKTSRQAVKEILNSNGRPNQASAFFFKAIRSLNDRGIIGCVIPTSFLTLDAYQTLRTEVNDLISIKIIGKLGNFIFEDALTDVSLIVGHKPKEDRIPFVLWTKNEKGIAQKALRDLRKMYYSNSLKVDEKDYNIYQPVSFPITKENWKPLSFKENELFKTIERFVLENKLARVQDIFNVKQGIRTGHKKAFKISREEFNEIPQTEHSFFRPALDNDSIKNGMLMIKNYVWYPYNEAGLVIKTEQELKDKVPFFYEKKLTHFKDSLKRRARKNDSNWWHLSEHRAWLRKRESRLVCTEFGKADSFAFDKDGIYAVERGNALLPKKKFKKTEHYYFYLALFSSPFYDKLLSIYSKQLLAGWDLGHKYTKDIPIPNVHLEIINSSVGYSQLVEIGKQLSEGNLYLKTMLDDILHKHFYPEG